MYFTPTTGPYFDPNTYNGQLANIQRQINTMQHQTQLPVQQPLPTAQQVAHVSGLDGARMFQKSLGPESSAVVLDNDADIMYMVSTDANGNPKPIAVCHYTVEMENSQTNTYVTKADFEELRKELKQLLMKEKPDEQSA